MSTKTLRKRIALVAVSALTAGVFSVVSAPSANAAEAAGDIDFSAISDLVNVGVCSLTNSTAINTTVATARSGSTVQLVRGTLGNAADNTYFALSGPAVFVSHTIANGTTAAATVTPTTITDGTAVAGDLTRIQLTGVGTVTVSYGADATSAVVDNITITSVATCANNVWDATRSLVQMSTTAAGNAASNVDAATSTTAGTPMYIKIQPVDTYGAAITTGGQLMASATNGAKVAWGAAAAGFIAGTGSVAVATSTANSQLRVDPASSATTSTTTVTITLNGGAVTTKTITFHGEQASIKVGTVKSGRTSTGDTGYVLFTYQDSAGNTVPGSAAAFVAASAGTRITTGTSIKAPTSSAATVVGTAMADNVEVALGSVTTAGVMNYTCGSSAGAATFTIATVSTVNSNVLTAPVNGLCYGDIASHTVSFDKASYKIGEIATLTISAKDAGGNPVSDNTQLTAGALSIGGGSPTYTILGTNAAAAAEVFSNGSVKLQAQMTTAGTFNTVVSLGGLTSTAGYSISGGDASNAEVLKSIVALIASINKQIQALQKLILRR